MKNVLIVVRESPFNRLAPTEALRLAAGLTLKENRVSLLFIDEGIYNLLPLDPGRLGRPSRSQYTEVYDQLGIRLFVEKGSAEARNIPIPHDVTALEREAALQMIAGADAVVSFG